MPVRTAINAAARAEWAIFQRRYCRMESPAVFLFAYCLTGNFHAPENFLLYLPESSDGTSHFGSPHLSATGRKKPRKEKMAAAATAETGYGRES